MIKFILNSLAVFQLRPAPISNASPSDMIMTVLVYLLGYSIVDKLIIWIALLIVFTGIYVSVDSNHSYKN